MHNHELHRGTNDDRLCSQSATDKWVKKGRTQCRRLPALCGVWGRVVDELEFYSFFFFTVVARVKVVWIISASDPNFENMENGLDIHVELWIQIIQIHLHMDEHKILHCKNPTKMVCSIIGSGISKHYKRIFLLYTMTQFVLAYGRF